MVKKYYSKKQLYVAAGVSRTTFYRWLAEMQDDLTRMGVKPYQQLLPPHVVDFICQKVRICPENLP